MSRLSKLPNAMERYEVLKFDFSRHSAKKSTSACDLIAVLGLKSISKAPSSTAHFEILPVAFQLWNISANGKSVITKTLYSLK